MVDVPQLIHNLVEKFEENINEYKNPKYHEAHIRVEFVNPFWEALGWDVTNESGYVMAYRDVIHEDEIKVGSATKAPDYSFRIGGVRQFFLETKKPAINLKDNPAPAFQLRRYAYSAKLPISVLTDFEEFIIYDCRIKPAITDKPSVGRVRYFSFRDYLEKWDEISSILSKESVLKGRLDKFVEGTKSKRGTAEIDKDFLADLDKWRIALARSFALRNKQLSARELNYTVQLTIDRLIFLRMCEDRGIENYGQLLALLNGANIYSRLVQIYKKADDRYNSGLFHFKPEKGMSSPPDLLTPDLTLDDKVLKEIIKHLYYPDCPYEFSMLPVEVLGNAYEQFLGKVIHLTKGHQAKIEEKPEVRKAGGVYYTPKYIVDYIVENTVGKLCEGKTPKEIRELRILDPACGSGSFLLGAFQYLLDWHLKFYQDERQQTGKIPTVIPDKGKRKRKTDPHTIYQGRGGQWFLTTTEKKRILTNNIYGVDIDANAVEVTKLSLLLKVLENESQDSLTQQLSLWHQRALPDLGSNIKCGNSLIGSDFYDNKPLSLFDEDEILRINTFDWEKEYPEIFVKGGFDAVIGNPPYVGFHGVYIEKDYLKEKYYSAKAKFDLYLPFIEIGFVLLKHSKLFGFICPTNFMKRGHGENLRELLSRRVQIKEICDFKHKQIFKGATNYTCIFIFENNKPVISNKFIYKEDLNNKGFKVDQSSIGSKPWIFRDPKSSYLIDKIENNQIYRLGKIALGISEGIVTGKNSVFLLKNTDLEMMEFEKELLRPCIRGKSIQRFYLNEIKESVIYPYKFKNGRTEVISEKALQNFKNVWNYLINKRSALKGRPYFESSSKKWFELWCQRDIKLLNQQKIVVPELSANNRFSLAKPDEFYGDTVCGITFLSNIVEKIQYFLGLLNSKLIEFYFKKTTVPKAGGFYIYKTMFLKNIPLRKIYFVNPSEKAQHDKMVELVQQMLGLHKKLAETKEPQLQNILQRNIQTTDNQIDQLVYQLYDLTEDEIKIVEEAVK